MQLLPLTEDDLEQMDAPELDQLDMADPVRHWTCQDNAASPVLLDAMGNGNGTLTRNSALMSGLTGVGGYWPRALQFNGTTDQATIAELTLPGEFSLMGWNKRTGTTTHDFLMGHNGRSEAFGHHSSATLAYMQAVNTGGNATPAHGIVSTNWHHLALIRTAAGLVKMYVNGVLTHANLFGGAAVGNSQWNRIANNFGNAWFAGYLADVRVYAHDVSSIIPFIYGMGLTLANVAAPQMQLLTPTLLGISIGEWEGSPSSYDFQWKRATSLAGAGAVNVGENDTTYSRTAADMGRFMGCVVTASNGTVDVDAAATLAGAEWVLAFPESTSNAAAIFRAPALHRHFRAWGA